MTANPSRQVLFPVLAVAAAILVSPSAQAQTPEQQCIRTGGVFSAGQIIQACSTAIQSGKHKGSTLAAFYTNRAFAHEDAKEPGRAIDDFSQAIKLEPTASRYDARCSARSVAGIDLNLALADCNEALRLSPGSADARDSRGFVYLRLGRLDEAIIDYNEALRLSPNFENALYGRGLARLRKGDSLGGLADIAASKGIETAIAERFGLYGVTTPDAAPVLLSAPSAAPDCARAETHWKSAEELKSLAGYEDHLARFSACDFAGLARARIETMKK